MGSIPSTLDIFQNTLLLKSRLHKRNALCLKHFASKNKNVKQNKKPKQQTTKTHKTKTFKESKPQSSFRSEKYSKIILTFKAKKR